jgi:hypothetical protein
MGKIIIILTLLLAACGKPAPAVTRVTASAATPAGTPEEQPGPTATSPARLGIDKATYVSETYPDHSALATGQKFIKTWNIKNIGLTTWDSSFSAVLEAAAGQETMGSPAVTYFPYEVPPGKTLSLTIPLTAPAAPGTYRLYWTLKNGRGESFGVDGDRIWVLIDVCQFGQACSKPVPGGTSSASGVTATLMKFTPGPRSTLAQFCLTLPDRNYGPGPGSITLVLDQQPYAALSGGSVSSGCFEFEFPVSEAQVNQAAAAAISIGQVRILGGAANPQAA